jgi:anti-anti-sigma regulatory factor
MQEFAVMICGRRVKLVQYRGALDVTGATELGTRLTGLSRAVTDVILVDLSRVTSVHGTALTLLVANARACANADIGLAVSGLPAFSRRLLRALDGDRALPAVDDMVAATRWAAAWTPARPAPPESRAPTLPPGPRRYAPAGPERPWYEWR